MSGYEKLLLALDFHADNNELIDKAKVVAEKHGAEIYLIHVQEPLSVAYAADGFTFNEQLVSLQGAITKEAREKVKQTAEKLGVSSDKAFLVEGNPSNEIHRVAQEQGIDLIVLGTHGQKGIRLLLGSTASSVLHGVGCDVLTIRLGD